MPKSGPSEAELLSRFRLVCIAAILAAVVIYVLAGIFELPFLRPTFQLDNATLGVLIGALLLLLGIEGLSRIPGIGK
ncbi:MAG: hypothetical protein QOJ81_2186 [Chloroflexota bacterium]|nr:hypothetical protein [Chloroflexota bacterium]